MMDAAQLNAWMDRHFTRSAFRLETLQTYEVASDGSDYRRYLDGEPTWTPERKQPWLDHLAAERARGLRRSRVRVVTHPVTDYTRYECEWGYVPNVAAGEDVRILDDLDDVDLRHVTRLGDFWLVDNAVVTMRYADDGRFIGAERESHPGAIGTARDLSRLAWEASEPFHEWWARHPELHRDGARV